MPREKASAIARAILAGFDRHYALFRYNAQQAKARYERGDWHGIRKLARDRIEFYDLRVREAVERIESEFGTASLEDEVWPQVKRDYVLLLAEHRRPELAETFFNSVCTKLLHRSYFRNDIIFVRPAVSTQYLDSEAMSYRVYYPTHAGWNAALRQVLIDVGFACPFVDVERDLRLVREAAARAPRARVLAGGRLPDPHAAHAVHPQQGRVPDRPPDQRRRDHAVRAAAAARLAGPALHRRRAVRHRAGRGPVQLLPRLLHGGHGRALGVRASSCAR